MNDILRIARLKIALQRAFLGRAILIFTLKCSRLFGSGSRGGAAGPETKSLWSRFRDPPPTTEPPNVDKVIKKSRGRLTKC